MNNAGEKVYNKSCVVDVAITVAADAPEDVISRALTQEWAETLYAFDDEDEVLEHLVYNCVANGVEDASRLDGWADLPYGALQMSIDDVSVW